MSSSHPWSISVKTVGLGFTSEEEATTASSSTSNANGERHFVVEVSPEDGVASLHDKIEGATGLKASQQRLIYRGRLIGKNEQQREEENEETRIKDIAGLCDGQTIHLVKKRDRSEESNSNQSNSGNNNGSSDSSDFLGSGGGGGGGGSLLAALLGLGNLTEEISEENGGGSATVSNSNTPSAVPATATASPNSAGGRGPRWGWRSSRIGRPRRPHYRLTAEDLQVNDPGTMEPVRQGLMTLHTLLPHAEQVHSDQVTSPLEANREWFRGQWIDCRDTVNQWLEATVVEIMNPDDILPPKDGGDDDADSSSSSNARPETLPRHQRLPHVANDPAVSAADLEGRRRLLLEPCDANDSDAEEGSLAGFRRRSNNVGVQLLLIHYNGWPHRWDEWIRSDSERIRPFRTRTRHPNVSSTASPTPQSVFNDAPNTNIRSVEEEEDRAHMLPELARAVSVVNDLLSQVAASEAVRVRPGEGHDDLPWVQANSNNDNTTSSSSTPNYNRRQLQNLAPLLDRLGRTLTDAAPHVAALADSLPSTRNVENSNAEDDDDVSAPDSLPDLRVNGDSSAPPAAGGLLSLWNRERRNQNNMQPDEVRAGLLTDEHLDPDYVDFASGVVNTSRGEVRAGPSRRPQNDDVASLLGAYLAAASLSNAVGGDDNGNEEGGVAGGAAQSLGNILRERGSGGGGGSGGIDIHIHAVVTTPGGAGGGGAGGLGLAALGGGNIPTATVIGTGGGGNTGNSGGGTGRTLFASRDRSSRTPSILRSRHSHSTPTPAIPVTEEIEDTSLFSELYSENPEPVDPNGSPAPDARRASRPPTVEDDEVDFIRRIAAMNEGDDNDSASANTRRSRTSFRRQSNTERRGWGRLFRRRRSHRDSNL